jgi:hypothetical protein
VSAADDVFGNGKTAIRGGFGRYNLARTTAIYNPATSIATSANRSWNDINRNFFPDCDLLNNAANGECGPQSNARFGTANVTTNIADSARNDHRRYNLQATVGVQQELVPGTSDIGTLRRIERSLESIRRDGPGVELLLAAVRASLARAISPVP